MGDAGFAGIAALDAADAEEFFAAALEVGFDGFYVGWGGQGERIVTERLLAEQGVRSICVAPLVAPARDWNAESGQQREPMSTQMVMESCCRR